MKEIHSLTNGTGNFELFWVQKISVDLWLCERLVSLQSSYPELKKIQ
jgi:hypothetical protein